MPNADLDGGGSGHAILTNGSLVALTEYCPDGGTTRQLVTDLADRLVTELDAGTGNQVWSVVLSDQTIAFIGYDSHSHGDGRATCLDDLGTSKLVDLGDQVPDYDMDPRVAGRYVLWYAGTHGYGGHLARP